VPLLLLLPELPPELLAPLDPPELVLPEPLLPEPIFALSAPHAATVIATARTTGRLRVVMAR
jgi:hypothetical protein